MLGYGNIIFFIYVLQESIVYTIPMSLLPGHVSINPQFSLQMNPVLIYSNIIPELNQEAEQRVFTHYRDGFNEEWGKKFDRIIYMRNGKIISDANRE